MSLATITAMGYSFATVMSNFVLNSITTRGYGPARGNLVFMGFVSK